MGPSSNPQVTTGRIGYIRDTGRSYWTQDMKTLVLQVVPVLLEYACITPT